MTVDTGRTITTRDVVAQVAQVAQLANDVFAARAAEYDQTARFPTEDFDDLFAAGLNAPTVPTEYGGLGLGPYQRNTLPLWMMTTALARADLSLARCWEGHANSMVLIDALGSPPQRERWFDGVVARGEKWAAWSGEPPAPAGNGKRRFGTDLTRTRDGWVVDGTKIFATSAAGADHAILLVHLAGPGGARHHEGSDDGLIMLACDLSHPSITIDGSWWDPIGMRATVSHLVRFDHTPIPDSCRIGEPGDYLRQGWQTAFAPHYAASFLGAAEAAYDYTLDHARQRGKTADPYVQHRVGTMAVDIETAHLWLAEVAARWDRGDRAGAEIGGNRARHLLERLSLAAVDHCVRVCGAGSLIRPSPVERIVRDLTLYARHDNDDHILATIGRQILGQQHDLSFYRP